MNPLSVPAVANRYVIQRQLGMGAMGAVFRVLDRLTGNTLALKRVLLSGDNNPLLRLALAREFQMLASLRHPNIISVQDYGFDEDQRPFITMTLLEDPQDFSSAAATLSDRQKIALLIQMLQALAYLHRRGIIHRDLKPANVLVLPDQTLKMLDFGLAVEADIARDVGGTLLYMAPEVLKQQGATAASDLFAVGLMAFEIFAGVHPFDAVQPHELIMRMLNSEPDWSLLPELDITPDDHSPTLRTILYRLLQKEPSQRYPDATSVIRDLSAALHQPPPVESSAIRESFLQAARFVGREHPMQQLHESLDQLAQGNGSQWWVSGESGVGKTRLLDELRHVALVRGVTVLRGQEVAESSTPYQLWREPVRRMTLMVPISDVQAAVLREIVPEIADILQRDLPPITRLDSRDERRRLAVTIADLFRQTTRPLLLLLEDLHWSDESLDVLELLTQTAPTVPLMLVATYRSDEAPNLAARYPSLQWLALERLPSAAIQDLVSAMLGRSSATPSVVRWLTSETEGNAYFLVETLRVLAEERGGLAAVTSAPLPLKLLAGGVQAVVERRLGRLPDTTRSLLIGAAMIGRQLDTALLRALVTDSPISLEEWLTTCANAGILEKWDERWRFAHDKLRDGVLVGLDSAMRVDAQRQVALAIERVYPNDPAQAHRLADHWRDADDPVRAAAYAASAARRALQTASFSDARQLLQRALPYASDAERITLIKQLGDAEEGLSNYPAALEHYAESRRLADELGSVADVAAALDGIARVEDRHGNLSESEAHFTEALALARTADATRLIADTLNGLGTVAAKRGQFEQARAFFGESLTLRRQLNDLRGIAASLNNLGIVHNYQGQFAQARPFYEEALTLRRRIGDLRGIAQSLNNLAMVTRGLKNPREARNFYLEAVQMTRNNGDLYSTATILNNLALILIEDDEFREAQLMIEETVRIGRSIGDSVIAAVGLQALARIARLDERYADAEPLLAESLTLLQAGSSPRALGETLAELGALRLALGQPEAANTALQEALTVQQTAGDTAGQAATQLQLGRAALDAGDTTQAETLLYAALRGFVRTRAVAQTQAALLAFVDLANHTQAYAQAARLLGTLRVAEVSSRRLREQLMLTEAQTKSHLTIAEFETLTDEGAHQTVETWVEKLKQG